MANEHVQKLTNTQPPMNRVKKANSLFCAAPSEEGREDDLIQQCLYFPAHRQRIRGRQKTVYVQHIAKAISDDALM